MPVRNSKNEVTESKPKKVEGGKIFELGKMGAEYLRLKKQSKDLTAVIGKKNKALKQEATDNRDLFTKNGNHLEVYAPLGDGANEIFIQLQTRESTSMVSDIIAQVKSKLGKKAENFIYTTEVLHKDALESMYNQGLITEEDILDWTTTKSTESLIVKANKKKS